MRENQEEDVKPEEVEIIHRVGSKKFIRAPQETQQENKGQQNPGRCGYTRFLPEVTLWGIALGSNWFGFPVRHIANIYQRSTFDLTVFGRKFNSSWRIYGYLEQRQVKRTHCEPRKLDLFESLWIEFVTAQHHKNAPSMCCGFRIYFTFFFHPIGWFTLAVR